MKLKKGRKEQVMRCGHEPQDSQSQLANTGLDCSADWVEDEAGSRGEPRTSWSLSGVVCELLRRRQTTSTMQIER